MKYMSMPNIPNITPIIDLDRCEVINLLLSSIALEEIGLSHILNAEGEKLQAFLNLEPNCPNDFHKINQSVNKTLRSIIKSQMLLQFKLEDVIELDSKENNSKCLHCNNNHCNGCDHHVHCPNNNHKDSTECED